MSKKVYRLFLAILCGLSAIFFWSEHPACAKTLPRKSEPILEFLIIWQAANRNGCLGDDFLILLAIRKAENGRVGREFGILHPNYLAQIEKEPHRSLDIQASWAAATIVKNKVRWLKVNCFVDFITFLGERCCPKKVDPEGHKNWVHNVRYWYERFKNAK